MPASERGAFRRIDVRTIKRMALRSGASEYPGNLRTYRVSDKSCHGRKIVFFFTVSLRIAPSFERIKQP